MQIEILDQSHKVADFDCGTDSLNNYLKLTARKKSQQQLGQTFVAVEEGIVIGYYSLVAATVSSEVIPDINSPYPIPVTLITALAATADRQSKGSVGPFLLKDALSKAYQASKLVGSNAVTLDALNDRAKQFYLKYGFSELLDGEKHLFLPMKKIQKLIEPQQ